MSDVGLDEPAAAIVIGGRRLFPTALSDGPPLGRPAPGGGDAWQEIATAGVNMLRTGSISWTLANIDAQIAAERARLDAAAARGLRCWIRLSNAAQLPTDPESVEARLLSRIVPAF